MGPECRYNLLPPSHLLNVVGFETIAQTFSIDIEHSGKYPPPPLPLRLDLEWRNTVNT